MSTGQKTIRLFLHHAFRYKRYVIGILLWMPILVVLNQIIPPMIAAGILDKLAAGTYVSGDVWASFGSMLVVYALLVLLTNTIGWRIIIYMVWTLEIKVLKDIMEKIFNHLTMLDMEFHNNSFGGSLVSRSNKLLSSYVRLADTFIFQLYGMVIVFVATGVVLWSKAPQFVIAFYAISVVYMFIAVKITRRIRVLSSIEASKQNKVTGYLADMITNVMAVKSFSAQRFENARFHKATTANATASNNLKWAQLHRENAFGFITGGISVIALVIATTSVVMYDAEIGTVFLVLNLTANMTTRLGTSPRVRSEI